MKVGNHLFLSFSSVSYGGATYVSIRYVYGATIRNSLNQTRFTMRSFALSTFAIAAFTFILSIISPQAANAHQRWKSIKVVERAEECGLRERFVTFTLHQEIVEQHVIITHWVSDVKRRIYLEPEKDGYIVSYCIPVPKNDPYFIFTIELIRMDCKTYGDYRIDGTYSRLFQLDGAVCRATPYERRSSEYWRSEVGTEAASNGRSVSSVLLQEVGIMTIAPKPKRLER